MDKDAWTSAPPVASLGAVQGSANFARYEGMPTGTMTLNEGVVVSKYAYFSNGVIDFDMKPIGYNDAGIIFRERGTANGEFFYLRANPDCPAADDCIQYAPVTSGLMAWNIYPNYQKPADVRPATWNHIRLIVDGAQLQVYLNHDSKPCLIVPRLGGLATEGGVAFKGPAVYANLVISNAQPSGHPEAVAAPVAEGVLTRWLVAGPTAYDRAQPVSFQGLPSDRDWRSLQAEPGGLVNLGREYGFGRAPSLSLGWLKATIFASSPVHRKLRIGFAPEIWVFLNGKLVYAGVNTYYPSDKRLSVDGRLQPDNAEAPLDLEKGENQIVLAVGNDWRPYGASPKPTPYGWGAEAQIDDTAGLVLP